MCCCLHDLGETLRNLRGNQNDDNLELVRSHSNVSQEELCGNAHLCLRALVRWEREGRC